MDPILVVSPHLDDAVLSLGAFIANWPGAYVLTVFAGAPQTPMVTSFDVHSGFVNSDEALQGRWDEDDRALAALGAVPLRAQYLDNQYNPAYDPLLVDRIADTILGAAEGTGAVKVFGPLGLAHPDHVAVSSAIALVAHRIPTECWAYEDVPSRVLWPEQVPDALQRWSDRGFDPQLGFVGGGDQAKKRAAVACYRSQLWALDQDTLYVPERTWRLWPVPPTPEAPETEAEEA